MTKWRISGSGQFLHLAVSSMRLEALGGSKFPFRPMLLKAFLATIPRVVLACFGTTLSPSLPQHIDVR